MHPRRLHAEGSAKGNAGGGGKRLWRIENEELGDRRQEIGVRR